MTEMFSDHSMFKTLTAFSANMFNNPGFDTLIMRYDVILCLLVDFPSINTTTSHFYYNTTLTTSPEAPY